VEALAGAPDWLVWLAAAAFGLVVGSFLNVVIHRLPVVMERQERRWAAETLAAPRLDSSRLPARYDLVAPRSACPRCGHAIRAAENIPVVSWLLLRGRCRGCGAPISARYPVVELLAGAAAVAVVLTFGLGWTTLWILLLSWALLALTVIDLDHQLLPDVLVLPLLWLGLLVNLDGTLAPLTAAVLGAVIGYGALWSVYWAFRLITGKEGMGHGDFKLMGAMGAWLGWQALPGVILLASLTGVIAAVAMMVSGRLARGQPMPFGPFIAVAGWLALLGTAWGWPLPGVYPAR